VTPRGISRRNALWSQAWIKSPARKSSHPSKHGSAGLFNRELRSRRESSKKSPQGLSDCGKIRDRARDAGAKEGVSTRREGPQITHYARSRSNEQKVRSETKGCGGLRPSFSAHVRWCERRAPVWICGGRSRLELDPIGGSKHPYQTSTRLPNPGTSPIFRDVLG
jgi:hypothetical protein